MYYPGVCTIQECVLSRSVYYPRYLLAKFDCNVQLTVLHKILVYVLKFLWDETLQFSWIGSHVQSLGQALEQGPKWLSKEQWLLRGIAVHLLFFLMEP